MSSNYVLLDEPANWLVFSTPSPLNKTSDKQHGLWQSQVVVEGMHCGSCALNVEKALRSVPGVKQATVNGATHRAEVVWSADQVKPSQWLNALHKAGYEAVPANDHVARSEGKLEVRRQLWRWAVAGFCMMQVMMYALPPYVSTDITAEMLSLLRWAAWVLTLPVMFFSADVFTAAAWRDLKRGNISMDLPVAIGIWVSFLVSSAAMFSPDGFFGNEVYFDSITMFVFFLLTGRWLEARLRERTAGSLEALINRLPPSVRRQRADGEFDTVGLVMVKPGDVLQVRPGEVFAADGRLLRGHTWVEEALLSGESEPLERRPGDALLAGSHNLRETVSMQVTALGKSTRYAAIVSLMQTASLHKPRLAALADRIAKPFLLAVLVVAALAAVWAWGESPGKAMMVAVSVLIVTCPCALSLATPAAMLAAAGNRLSLGIQDFDSQVQQAVHRLQTVEQVDALMQAARAIGFGSVNLDLIYGLPLQTEVSWQRTLQAVLQLRPDRLAIYGYAHLPARFKPQRHIHVESLPSALLKASMLEMALEQLQDAGYVYIGMDHFALPEDGLSVAKRQGRLHRNFQGYSTRPDGDLLGLGVSSIGSMGSSYVQNAKLLDEYSDLLQQGKLPVVKGIGLTRDDLVRRSIIMALMCQGRVELADIEQSHLLEFSTYFATELTQLEAFAKQGLIEFDSRVITVTATGWYLVRAIAMVFDKYVQSDEKRTHFSKIL